MTKVLITIEGGLIQSISANTDDVRFVIVDYDNRDLDESDIVSPQPFSPDEVLEDGKFSKQMESPKNLPLTNSEKIVLKTLKSFNW
jgi:hypothetical protein